MYLIIIYTVLISLMVVWQILNIAPFFKLYHFQKEVAYEKVVEDIRKPFKTQLDVFDFNGHFRGLAFILSLFLSMVIMETLDFTDEAGWMKWLAFIMGAIIGYLFLKNIVTSPHLYKVSILMEDLFNGNLARTMSFLNHAPHHEKYEELSEIELNDILREDLQQIRALNEYGLQYTRLSEKLLYKHEMFLNSIGLSKEEMDALQEEISLTIEKRSQVEEKIWNTMKVLYSKFFKTEEEMLEEDETLEETEDETEEEELIQTIHIGEKEFTNEWVVRVFASCANSKDMFIHHVGGFQESEKEELDALLSICRQMLHTNKEYQSIEGFEYWFAPSSLFESDWEGISPTIKRLAQDWSIDPTASMGTLAKITSIETVQYDKKGNIIQTIISNDAA